MATWVRSGTGSNVAATNADVSGNIALDNATAPSDFGPANVTSVQIQWRFTISGLADDDWDDFLRARLIGSATNLASVNGTDSNETADGTFDHDITDNAPNTGSTTAAWEAAVLDGNGIWAQFNANMMPDGSTGTIVAANCTVTITYTPNATLDQVTYRYRDDDGSESAATWRVAENTNDTLEVDTNYRMRFTLDDTASGERLNFQPQLEYNLASAGWNDVTGASSVIRATASGNFADDDDTTRQLSIPTGGTFITPNSGMDEDNGLAGEQNDIDFANGTHDFVEVEFCFQIRSADVTDAQTVQLRIKNADAWTVTPTITINEVSLTFEQTQFRIRPDDHDPAANANTGADWEAAVNTDVSLRPDLIFGLRIEVEASAAVTEGFKLYAQKNGTGGYSEVPTNATPFISGLSQFEIMAVPGSYTDGAATTELLAGDQTFRAGNHNDDGQTATVAFAGLEQTELEWRIIMRKLSRGVIVDQDQHVADGEFWDFRVYKDDDTALDTYTQEPRVTVLNWPGHIGGAMAETPGRVWVQTKDGALYAAVEYADQPTSAANIVLMKSEDQGVSWNPVDEAGQPATFSDLEGLDMHYVAANNTIYFGGQISGNDVRFATFLTSGHATAPDTWDLDELVDGAVTAPADQAAAIHWRSDGTAVIFYQEGGTDERIRYRIRSTVPAWGGENDVDGEASTDMTGVKTVMDPADDTIHIFYHAADGTNGEIWHKTLNSSDTLSGRTQVDQTATIDNSSPPGNGSGNIAAALIWTDGVTNTVGVAYQDSATDDLIWNMSPTASIDFTNDEEIALTDVDQNTLGGREVDAGLAVDDIKDVVYAMGGDLSTNDLMYDSRPSGGSFGTDTDWSTEIHKLPIPEVLRHSGKEMVNDPFTGTNGDPWDAWQWVTGVGSGSTIDIQGNMGRMQHDSAAAAYARASALMDATADLDLLVKVRWETTGIRSHAALTLRGDGAFDTDADGEQARPENGYYWSNASDSSTWSIQSNVAGINTQIGTNQTWANVAQQDWWLRFRVMGTKIQARMWQDGGAEPDTWDVDEIDTDHASGILQVGIAREGGNIEMRLDDLVCTRGLPNDGTKTLSFLHSAKRDTALDVGNGGTGFIHYDEITIAEDTPPTDFVGFECVDSPTSDTTLTIRRPFDVIEDDVMLAFLTHESGADPTWVGPSGWTKLGTTRTQSESNHNSTTWWKAAGASEPDSYDWTVTTGNQWKGCIVAYRNRNTTSPIDDDTEVADANAANPTLAVTTTEANCILVQFWTYEPGVDEWYQLAAMREIDNDGIVNALLMGTWDEDAPTATTYSRQLNFSENGVGDDHSGHLVALAPAGAGAALFPPFRRRQLTTVRM